jgi:hypothetical protein
VPGPLLTVPPGDPVLTINLQNKLPEPTSIVIPGQIAAMAPVRNADGRVRSFTAEAALGGTATYTWGNFRPGSFIYHRGTHLSLQVPMGLYGGVVKNTGPNEAYPGVSYDREVVLFFSEIDPALNASASSTVEYDPHYFLINGIPFSNTKTSWLFAGRPGERILLRFLNAGSETHVPIIPQLYMSLVAEDGNTYAHARQQYAVDLPALKTADAIITPSDKATYPMYDRRLNLTNATSSPGGMLAYLSVVPPLVVVAEPEVVVGGAQFACDVELSENVTRPFDFYFLADTPYGIFTVSLDGKKITPGIKPLYRNVRGVTAPYFNTVWKKTGVPSNLKPGIYTFYAAFVEAGTVPPVSSPAEVTSTTPHIILFDKEPVELQ